MKRRNLTIGPGAASLLLVIVVASMSVLGLLALMSARGDEKLMQRSRDFVTAEYETAAQAERSLAALDALLESCAQAAGDETDYLARVAKGLPAGMTLTGDTVAWTQTGTAGRSLRCAVTLAQAGETPRFTWKEHRFGADGAL